MVWSEPWFLGSDAESICAIPSTTYVPSKTFTLKGQEVSLDEYREGVFQSLKKNGNTSIHPEAILGYVEGSHVDFKLYDNIGFNHPKEKSYYELAKGDEKFLEIFLNVL